MKKLLIIATLAAVGMGACSKDDGVSAPEDLRKYVQVTIPENAASGETRTSVDGTTTSWVAGYKVAVSLYNGSTTEVCEFTVDRTGATTTFSGSVPVGSYTCAAAHYPFCAATFDAVNKTFTHTWGDAYCSTDLAAYDFMFSTVYETPFVVDETTTVLPIALTFRPLMARIGMKLALGANETPKYVTFTTDDNVLPTADFSYSPQMISIGTTVTFTDKSTDSDGEIVSREWLFPDGTTSTDINATYTFEQMGMFNVQLTVTDDRGGSNSTSKAINVRAGDVNAFTLLWSTAVASADALCAASVVAASDMGYIYSVSGDGKMVALNTDGAKVWEYDAMAKDGVYLKSEISYPSVDTDGTVYWVAHGYGGSSSASLVYAFDGATGSVLSLIHI